MSSKNWFSEIIPAKIILLVFIFSLAMIQGISFTIMNNYTESMSPDALNYMEIAKGNFDQEPIQKYRVLVPFMAAGIDAVLGGVFEKIRPWSFDGDFSLFVSFWIVNTILMALFSVAVFLLCRAYNISIVPAFIGLLVIFSCRWTCYMAGLPIIDSLFCLVCALALLAIKNKNNALLIFLILLGPWAKESFIFVAPVIFFFASMNKVKQIAWFLASGILVFSFRFYYDQYTGSTLADSLLRDVDHLNNIQEALLRLFSFHGIYELFSVTGVWLLIPVYLLIKERTLFREQLKNMDWFMYAYLVSVFIQAIISSELARMFYLALPVLAVYVAMSAERLFPSLKDVQNRNQEWKETNTLS